MKNARAVAAGVEAELHVGYAPSLTASFLPQALRAFHDVMPKVRVRLHDCSTAEMLAGLREAKLELAFTVRVGPGLLRRFQFAELRRDPICLAAALNHRLARKRTVTLQEAALEPLITYSRKDYPDAHQFVTNLFARMKSKPAIAEEHDSVSSLIAAVEAGNGVAVATRSLECISGLRLKLIPISPAPEPLIIGAAWIGQKLSPSAEQFLDCAKQLDSKMNR